MARKFNIHELTKRINTARMEAGEQRFEKHSLFRDYMHTYKVTNNVIISKLYHSLKGGKFTNIPYHEELVKTWCTEATERKRATNNRYKENNTVKILDKQDSIQDAINFLKEHGYRILAPYTEYKEI